MTTVTEALSLDSIHANHGEALVLCGLSQAIAGASSAGSHSTVCKLDS